MNLFTPFTQKLMCFLAGFVIATGVAVPVTNVWWRVALFICAIAVAFLGFWPRRM